MIFNNYDKILTISKIGVGFIEIVSVALYKLTLPPIIGIL